MSFPLSEPEAPRGGLPSPNPAEPAVLDERMQELANIVPDGEQKALFQELLTMYREESLPRLRLLAAAWSAGDIVKAKSEAHFLAGSSANLGLRRLADWLRALEVVARQAPLPPADGLLPKLEAQWLEACAAFEVYAR